VTFQSDRRRALGTGIRRDGPAAGRWQARAGWCRLRAQLARRGPDLAPLGDKTGTSALLARKPPAGNVSMRRRMVGSFIDRAVSTRLV